MASNIRTGGFSGDYIDWQESRIAVTIDEYTENFFNGKTLLEVGAGWGAVGNHFYNLGSDVTISDARSEHMIDAKKMYPNLNCKVVNSENTKWEYDIDVFDVVIHWGTLYHLQNPEENIKLLSNHCKTLILETEVTDSDDPYFLELRDEQTDWESGAWGMAFSGVGSIHSYAWVERILTENGFDWKRLENTKKANAAYHHYDWERKNTGNWKSGQRAFWFCENKKFK